LRQRHTNGRLLNTTEVFDGNSWKLGAEMPTPRQMLGAASDDKVVCPDSPLVTLSTIESAINPL